MQSFDAIDTIRNAFITLLVVTSPVLIVSLIVGLLTGFLQAATQIQDQSLSFVPKLMAVFLTLAILTPWILEQLSVFATQSFSNPFGY